MFDFENINFENQQKSIWSCNMKRKTGKDKKSLSKLSKVLIGVGAVGSLGVAITYVVMSTRATARFNRLKAIPTPKPNKSVATQTQTRTQTQTQTNEPDLPIEEDIEIEQVSQQETPPIVLEETPPTSQNVPAKVPIADVNYAGMTLYDYPINEKMGPYSFTVNYQNVPLTVSFEGAPRYGLAKGSQKEENAKYIGQIMDVPSGKYHPTNKEILQLAYLVYRERSGLGRLSSSIELQRERAAMLWCILNRILKTGRSIERTLSSSDMVSYYRDFDDVSKMQSALAGQGFDYQNFVKAFFDGYFFNEVPQQTNWSHPVTLQKSGARWSTWHLPYGTKDASGNMIGNTSRTIPTAMEDCVFPRALEL